MRLLVWALGPEEAHRMGKAFYGDGKVRRARERHIREGVRYTRQRRPGANTSSMF